MDGPHLIQFRLKRLKLVYYGLSGDLPGGPASNKAQRVD
jgi:hypothetical protein